MSHFESLFKKADSDSVVLEWNPRFCISNKLLGDVYPVGPWITLCYQGNRAVVLNF